VVLVVHHQWPDDAFGPRPIPEEPKSQLQKSWDAWKAWAKLEEMDWTP
jgi:hypothetical protein